MSESASPGVSCEDQPARRAGVLVISDRASRGARPDEVGPVLKSLLEKAGFEVAHFSVVPDEAHSIESTLRTWVYADHLELVVTTGGTGLGPRDVTPDAVQAVADRNIDGLVDLMRSRGLEKTPLAALSRQVAVQAGNSLVLALPGSPQGALDSLEAVIPVLGHALDMIRGAEGSHDPNQLSREPNQSHQREPDRTTPVVLAGLTSEPLDTRKVGDALKSPVSGAVVTFEGVARSPSDGRDIDHLYYDAFESLANRHLEQIATDTVRRFGLHGAVALHRTGHVRPGEVIVVAAAAAAHRSEAFEGARQIIERIKAEAAIWKKEVYRNGEHWIGSEKLI